MSHHVELSVTLRPDGATLHRVMAVLHRTGAVVSALSYTEPPGGDAVLTATVDLAPERVDHVRKALAGQVHVGHVRARLLIEHRAERTRYAVWREPNRVSA